jgi:putative PEP-CTERM system TPR-repeat lipoprotein
MASAKELLAKGERDAAVIQLKNMLQQAPDNGEARLMLGQAMFDDGDYLAAEKELSRALELGQPHERVLPAHVLTLLALGKLEAVVTEVQKYKLFNPDAVAATQTALGDAFRGLGNSGKATEAYAVAIAAVPGYPRARLGQAVVIAAEGRLDEALMRTDEVIAAAPTLVEARGFRAQILLAKGDREGAKKAVQEAIAADERHLPSRLALITMLIDDQDFEEAARLIEGTRKVAPGDLRVTFLDALLALRRGEWERARQQVQQVLKFVPDDLASLELAGAIDLHDKQFVSAESSLRTVVARAPDRVRARVLLVRTYLGMGQPNKAKEVLQPLVDRGLIYQPRLQLLAGETYLANGDTQKATAHFEAAVKGSDAQQAVARTRLGQIALATGRTEEGFQQLEAASELGVVAYQAEMILILGHIQRRDLDKAMAAVKALEKKQPNNPQTFEMYGMVNLAKGDLDAARKSFDKVLELQPANLSAAYNLAQLDLVQKKPDDARKRYEAMIAKQPNNDELYLALAQYQARTGATPEAIAGTLQRAIKASPQAASPRLALIELQLRAGDTKAALATAQDALAAIPSEPRLLDAAGVAQQTAGEINQAISTYNKLASLQPQAVQPLYRLVSLYLGQKDTDKAIESLRRVQKIAPIDRDLVPQLVAAYFAAGRQEDALKEVRELQRRAPKSAGALALEGDIYLAQSKFSEAERMYLAALKLEPKANAVAIKRHAVLAAAGKNAEAEAWGKKWISENPRDASMRLYLGQQALGAGNLKAAAAHYQAAIGIEPGNVEALNNLALVGGELKDPKALGYAQRAVKAAPNNPDVLDTYGMLLVKEGEADKGLLVLERARKLAPARNDLRLHHAKALIKAGRKDDARKELEALQGVDGNFIGKEEVPGLLKGL